MSEIKPTFWMAAVVDGLGFAVSMWPTLYTQAEAAHAVRTFAYAVALTAVLLVWHRVGERCRSTYYRPQR